MLIREKREVNKTNCPYYDCGLCNINSDITEMHCLGKCNLEVVKVIKDEEEK